MLDRDDSDYFSNLLYTVLEACADAVIIADLDGVIIMFNEDAEAVLRKEALDVLGEDLFAILFPQEHIPQVKAALRDEGHVRHRESRIVVGKDEEEVFLEVTILKTPEAPGRARALMALIRNVTAR